MAVLRKAGSPAVKLWAAGFVWKSSEYRIFSNLIRTSFLSPCIVRTARTPALSFGETPALDGKSNPHSILIRICPFSPLQL
jgi:hypothetical protein